MDLQKKIKIALDFRINSSELTMLNQGALHALKITQEVREIEEIDFDEVTVSFQLEKDSQGRFDFINNEAAKHRKQWDEINAQRAKNMHQMPDPEVSP